MTDTMRVESLGPGHPTYFGKYSQALICGIVNLESDVPVSEILGVLSLPLQPQPLLS
jgi:hypothetical protein